MAKAVFDAIARGDTRGRDEASRRVGSPWLRKRPTHLRTVGTLPPVRRGRAGMD